MIQAQELRIGNWVSFKGLWSGQIASVSKSGLITIIGNDGCFDDEELQPIEITEHLLRHIGATEFVDSDLLLNHRVLCFAECRGVFYDKTTLVDIPSLHKLQNLYFALTGKELEVKF